MKTATSKSFAITKLLILVVIYLALLISFRVEGMDEVTVQTPQEVSEY